MRIHNHKLGNQILSLLMALVMVISMLPMSSFTALAAEGAVASVTVGGTTTSYDTFDAAITAVQSCTADDEAVLTLLKEIPLGDTYQKIEGGVFTLDLNGKLLSNTDTYGWEALQVGGGAQLTIIDSGTGGTIQSATGAAVRISEGDLIVKSGTLTGRSGVSVTSDCSATINGGNIHGTEYGIYCSGTVRVYGGTVTSDTRTVYVNSGSVTINSGDFTGSHNAVYIGSNGSVTINGGSFTGGSSDFSGYGSVSMTGATFPGGITLSIITLNAALADGQAYWTGDTMLAPADGATEITDKGDITVKAACTHDSGSKSYTDNGDNHTYTYSCCNLTVTENHTYADCVCLCGADVHTFTETSNGFCTECAKGYQPAELKYSSYEIGNAGQLMWFAELVNGGNKTANAILIDNIDMDSIDWTPICSTGLYYGSSYASGYGDADTGYAGIFDGNYHVIKNLSVTAIANETWTYGLFGTMTGTVKNLGIEGFTYNHNGATDMRTGAIVGQNLGGTIENCYVVKATITPGTNVAGGITGCNYAGTIKNCYVADSTVLASASRYGYIAGDNRADTAGDRVGTIENCYTDGDRLVGSYTGTETNSKYGVNYNYFTNGGVVWYLNGQSADGIWKQGETHPNFTGTAVTQSLLSTYTQPEIKDGVYQIKTESELRWFAEYVNFTDASVSAVLANDIAMTGDNWIPIGMYGTPFTGTFNGQGYGITGFAMTITEGGRFGLFGEISGATVKNFSIDGEVTANLPSQQTFYYGVIGASANSTITDIHSSVGLKVKDSFDKNGIAGIVASITTTTIERCSFSGTLDIGTAYIDCAGGIVGYAGWNNTHVIRDCAFYGKIIAKHESSDKTSSGQIGGILGYYRGSNITIESCLSVGTFDVANTTFTGMIGGRVLQMGADNISKVSNNYYYGNLPAFSDTEDNTHGYWSADMADYEGYGDTNAKSVTDTQLKSGEVTWLLNDGVADGTQVWYQTIGLHDYPVFEGATVNLNGTTYENTGNYIYVEITWTAMEFTYISGDWNPETHQYDEGYWWRPVVNNGEVHVTNKGSAVYVSFGYTSLVDGVSGYFDGDHFLEKDESCYSCLTLEGKPTGGSFTDQQIGYVTVTISQTPPASFTRWWEVGDTVDHIGKNGKVYSCYIADIRDGKYVLLTKEPEIFTTTDAEQLEALKETQLEAVGATRYPAFDSSKAEYAIYNSYALELLSASNDNELYISRAVNSEGKDIWLWEDNTELVVVLEDISRYYENYDIKACFYYIFEVPES